jgi:hypothetical protein
LLKNYPEVVGEILLYAGIDIGLEMYINILNTEGDRKPKATTS